MTGRVGTVLRAEYLRAVRSKAFLIGVFVMPILFCGGLIATSIAENSKDTRDRSFAVIDRTGALATVIETALEARNATAVMDGDEKIGARWILVPTPEVADGERVDVLLSSRVESGELLGFLELGADVLEAEGGEDRAAEWHTDSPTQDDLPDWLGDVVNAEIRLMRFRGAGMDAELAARLSTSLRFRTVGLTEVDAESGEVSEASEMDQIASVMIPVGLVMLLFMLVMMSTPALMNNVLEEKMQKIAEVLVSSVRPFDLLLGKLLSAVGVSLTLAVLYLGGLLVFLHATDKVPEPIVAAITPELLAWFLLFMLLALLIFGSIFSALGAACSEIQDTQTLMMPVMIVLVLPLMMLGPIIKSPDGVLAQVLTFFPPATPIVLFLRINVPPGAELWEIVVALALCIAFTLGCVKAGAKIFRIGVLSQGQTPSYRNLLGWLLSD